MKNSDKQYHQAAQKIPSDVAETIINVLSDWHPDEVLERKFREYGPIASDSDRVAKWRTTLNNTMALPGREAGVVVGNLLREFMEVRLGHNSSSKAFWQRLHKSLIESLSKASLEYSTGKVCSLTDGGLGLPTQSFKEALENHQDVVSIEREFSRALLHVKTDPRTSIISAGSLLETVFTTHLGRLGRKIPEGGGLTELWKAVRDTNLPFGGTSKQHDRISSLLNSVVTSIAGIRNEAAHFPKDTIHPDVEEFSSLHAKLIIHMAYTVSCFIVQTWEIRKQPQSERRGTASGATASS